MRNMLGRRMSEIEINEKLVYRELTNSGNPERKDC